jgi:DNA-binding MarR family transcriptional regulator
VTSSDVSPFEVGQLYLELHRHLHRFVDQKMTSAGLSLARAKVLLRLRENGPMNQATLAGLLGLAPRSVTEAIDWLERDELVVRTLDANDRRARIVALTAAGLQACGAAETARLQAMNETFGRLPPADRATLAALLTTIRSTLPSGVNDYGN